MIHYFEAQHPAELVTYLSQQLQKVALPLEAPWVVVPNREFQEWIEREISVEKGCSAHLNYVFPIELIWKLYRKVYPEVPKKLPTDIHALSFRIFKLLEEDELILSSYKGLENEMQRFALAQQYADVFDQYLNIRPQMVFGWERGLHESKYPCEGMSSDHLDIQMRLWKRIMIGLEEEGIHQYSRTSIYKNWFELLNGVHTSTLKSLLPKQLFVLGERDWGEVFLGSLEGISFVSEVHLLNYSSLSLENEHTYDSLMRNLFHKWQHCCRESEALLKLIAKNYVSQVTTQVSNKLFTLEKILETPGAIHICHSPKREVEVLKDHVLDYINSNPDISLDTIGISVPDIMTYAPIITHVFGQEPRLPVYVLINKTKSLRTTLIRLLELVVSSFKMNDLMDLLSDPNMAIVYDFRQEDLKQLKHWMTETHIHFGLEDNHPFSLKDGLLSWWRGFLFSEEEFVTSITPYPSSLVHKNDQLKLLSKVQYLYDHLWALKKELFTQRTALEWIKWIRKIVVDQFEIIRNTSGWIYDQEILWLDNLELELSYTHATISQELFLKWFRQVVVENTNHASPFGYGIQVSEHIPNRLIPFNFVAILGLNEQVLPGDQSRPIFDLIHRHPISGEREKKKDLQRLFIERLALAKQSYFLSYEGYDVHTNKLKNPSPYITQLIYLHQGYHKKRSSANYNADLEHNEFTEKVIDFEVVSPKLKVYDHRLHGFSENYFTSDATFVSYHKEYYDQFRSKQISQNPTNKFITKQFYNTQTKSQEVDESIDLNDMIRFYQHPTKYLLEKQLNIMPEYESNELTDFEQYDLNYLDRYLVKNTIWDSIRLGYTKSECESYLASKKIIPSLRVYQLEFDELYSSIQSFYDLVIPSQSEVDLVQPEIAIGTYTLSGSYRRTQEKVIQEFRLGSFNAKYAIEYWISFLYNLMAGGNTHAYYYYMSGNKPRVCSLVLDDRNEAEQTLKRIVRGYVDGLLIRDSMFFLPKSSFAFINGGYDRRNKKFDHNKALNKAKSEWKPKSYDSSVASESEDIWNRIIWDEQSPVEDDMFIKKSHEFWGKWNELSDDKPFKSLDS
ncbi:MAG: hypothetical protein CL672_05090 [Balneola sp.]|nr:hypothetical protein [Balneola sp.]